MVILLKTMIQITDDINFIKKLPLDEQKEYLKAYFVFEMQVYEMISQRESTLLEENENKTISIT